MRADQVPLLLHQPIRHSELEHKIFETLRAVVSHFGLAAQLRVAGGWVRDKLLGKECYDIDITLDNMLGKEFCDKVNEYLKSIDEEACNVGLILSNPEQSKHLETAQMEMFGMSIDFVNLRSEIYVEHSRIPIVKFGSPEEDAYRRDLTINSLFYNLNTCMVEDFTGRGLFHLRTGLIATPVPPKSSFLDDPLRVLRAIRFAARFNYEIQHDLREAAMDRDVKAALANKVSPERIGMEADLMIMCAYPVRAMQELVGMDIFWIVFRLPYDLKHHILEETQRSCIETLKLASEVLNVLGLSNYTKEQRRILYFAALLLPLRGITYPDRKKKQILLASIIIKDSLKLKAKDAEQVVSLHEAAEEFQKIISILVELPDNAEDWRVSNRSKKAIYAGMLLRKIKDLWRVSLILSSVVKLPLTNENHDRVVNERADICNAVEGAIKDLDLENAWTLNPLIDGKMIMAELGLKPGTKVKEWQDRIWEWQLCHSEGTANECLQWLREEHSREQS